MGLQGWFPTEILPRSQKQSKAKQSEVTQRKQRKAKQSKVTQRIDGSLLKICTLQDIRLGLDTAPCPFAILSLREREWQTRV